MSVGAVKDPPANVCSVMLRHISSLPCYVYREKKNGIRQRSAKKNRSRFIRANAYSLHRVLNSVVYVRLHQLSSYCHYASMYSFIEHYNRIATVNR